MDSCVSGDIDKAKEIALDAEGDEWLQDYIYMALCHAVTSMNAPLVHYSYNHFYKFDFHFVTINKITIKISIG